MDRILEVTTNIGCRLRCSYCPQALVSRKYLATPRATGTAGPPLQTMTPKALERYIESVPADVHVHFSGFSEPWHAEDCVDMIRMIHGRGHLVAVFTTADAMRAGDVARLVGIPFKRFLVHLPDVDGQMRKTVDDRYLALLKMLVSSDIHNLEFVTIGAPHLSINSVLGATPSTTRVHSRAGNVRSFTSTIAPAFSAAEIAAHTRGTTLVCRKDRIFANVLLPNGDVQLCSMDYGLEEKLGSLASETYAEIVNGAAFRRVLALLNDPDSVVLCRRCEYAIPGTYSRRPA
jgi:organic radical activating enzyme